MKNKTRNRLFKMIILMIFTVLILTSHSSSDSSAVSFQFSLKRPNIVEESVFFLMLSDNMHDGTFVFTYSKLKIPINRLESISCRNLKYVFAILSTIILLCGDVEVNPGPLNSSVIRSTSPIPSTSTGVFKKNVQNRDERFMRPYFRWQGNDSSIEDSQDFEIRNNNFDAHCKLPLSELHSDTSEVNSTLNASLKSKSTSFNSLRDRKYETCSRCSKRFTKRAIVIHMKHCPEKVLTDKNILDNFVQKHQKHTKKNSTANDCRPVDEVTSEDNGKSEVQESKVCKHCGKIFTNVRGLRIHIAKAHHDIRRKDISNKYSSRNEIDDAAILASKEIYDPQKDSESFNKEITTKIQEWVRKFSSECDDDRFCLQVTEFLQFLANIIHELPGPKHPARRYYEMRKKGKKYCKTEHIKCRQTL